MLTIKTNKNNCKLTYVPLNVSSITTGETVYDDITISTKDSHNLRENDEIAFVRNDGEFISYFKDCYVKNVISKTSFSIDGFRKYLVETNDYDLISVIKPNTVDSGEEMIYARLKTSSHIFAINRNNITIRRRYYWREEDEKYVYDGALTECAGDYYQYDDIFLVKNLGDENIEIKNITGLTITAITPSYDEPFILQNCLIGINYDGSDDTSHIYIPIEYNQEFISQLEDLLPTTTFIADDIRFLCDGINQMKIGESLQPGAYIDKVCGNIEVDFSIGDSFEVNLHHDEQVGNYIEKVKTNSINKIIDYERYQYTPMYYTGKIPTTESGRTITVDEYLNSHSSEIDGRLKKVNEIKFNLFFRTKDFTLYDEDGVIIPITGDTSSTDYVDFGTWQTDDTGYWNNYKLRSDHEALEEVYTGYKLKGDLLGYLGFTDDDVYYQKDAFKKSFLRLSFYDSPNRETQKLLYYSTIYFDTNVYSGKYINDLSAWREDSGYTPMYNQLVFAYDIEKKFNAKKTSLLTAEMSCTDKYDNSSSSDGFYLHLFDKLVSGDTCTPIYMKAEFNNAKFGKTVPMIRPIYKNTNVPINPVNSKAFPREYIKSKKNDSGETYTWTDMGMLLQDMYTKLFIKYNFKTQQFVWFVPQGGLSSDTLTFNLFEPRVNGYDFGAYNTLNGNNVGYGTDNGKPNWFNEGGGFNENGEWLTEDNQTESQWAADFNGCCLMTTATTIEGENMLNGTKLFNKSAMKKIYSIWIDGMMVYGDSVYDAETEEYTTTNIQLPDIPFTAVTGALFTAVTTQEEWNVQTEHWDINPDITPKKIHRVNYYFKTNTKDQTKLIDELYTGMRGHKKTKEITSELCTTLKHYIPESPSETLPKGMFKRVTSLRCIKTVSNHGYKFTTLGNGAFDYCQGLVRVTINNDSIDIIGKNCFTGCRSLKEADLANVKIILKEAFQGCYTLTKVTFATTGNNTIRYIGCGSFGYTMIREVQLPNTILRIGNSAFRRCYQLNMFKINGINQALTFGKRAFGDCAIFKYNLQRYLMNNGKVRYNHYGGVPNIIQYLLESHNDIEFYDTYRDRYVRLSVSSEKDRGKLLYHYKDEKYLKYIDKNRWMVLNFEKWLRYLS